MEEKIGKITLNLDNYPGEDLYSDGGIEDEILDIVQAHPDGNYREAIEESGEWPVLYHLSHIRENIVRWVPLKGTEKCLEVGSGCGAITGALAEMAGQVDCVDLSKKRSSINAYRHREADNVKIYVGNFQVVEENLPADYDYIFLIGAFEYGGLYIGGDSPYRDFLLILKKHLAPGGRIVIAIENKTGMKYWAGAKEDHNGQLFAGIEDYPSGGPARTFTYHGLEKLAAECGFSGDEIHMYYPYPDYKFMHTLYSDKRLPGIGECKTNLCNYDRDRWQIFDEKNAFDMVIREGEFPLFSNSYLMLLGPDTDTEYVHFSNDRQEPYRFVTEYHGKEVWKRPLTAAGAEHLKDMKKAGEELRARYAGGQLNIVPAEWREEEQALVFPKIEGAVSLEEKLDEALLARDRAAFRELVMDFYGRISEAEEGALRDLDLVFSNVLIRGDEWNVIDYEWTTREAYEAKEIFYRALFCYLLEDKARLECHPGKILSRLGITKELQEKYQKREAKFQKRVTGGYLALGEIRERIGNPVYSLAEHQKRLDEDRRITCRLQVYEDCGEGYSEETSYFPASESGNGFRESCEYVIEPPAECRNLRIDPCSMACLVLVESFTQGGVPVKDLHIFTNGKSLGGGLYLFLTADPQFELRQSRFAQKPFGEVRIRLKISELSAEMAESLL